MKQDIKKKVIIAMSGGVDSSVAAKLLKDQGHEVVGIFLHFWKEKGADAENKCCSREALADAYRVCQKINIPLYTLNFVNEFKKVVVDNFISEYKNGKTPNPCVVCNKNIKIGMLIEKAKELGFDFVATGHYVKLGKKGNEIKMKKAADIEKDQTYFLYTFSQEQLKHLLFPLGNYKKSEVRKLAKKFVLPTAEKKESQEICFVDSNGHNAFLKRNIKLIKGDIKTLDGKLVGHHDGLPLYTIGQRKGIEIGGTGPYYAAKMDYKTNTLFVAKDGNDPVLYNDKLIAENVNWISGKEPKDNFVCEAVIRYRHKSINCQVKKLKVESNKYEVTFSEPQRAITPGQSVVFYKKEELLGGGIIE